MNIKCNYSCFAFRLYIQRIQRVVLLSYLGGRDKFITLPPAIISKGVSVSITPSTITSLVLHIKRQQQSPSSSPVFAVKTRKRRMIFLVLKGNRRIQLVQWNIFEL